jgi:hypothetical protein
MKITRGKWQLAVGVDWSMPGYAGEIRQLKRANPRRHFFSAAFHQQTWLGFHDAVRSLGTTYSGALLVGMVERHALVCMTLNEDWAWMCVVSDGMPLVGHDLVVAMKDVARLSAEWASVFHGARLVGNLQDNALSLESVLLQLEDDLAAKAISKRQLAAATLRVQGTATQLVMRIAIGVAIAGACSYAWQGYNRLQRAMKEASDKEMRQAEAAALAEHARIRALAERRKAIDGFASQIRDQQASYAKRLDAAAFWAATARVRGDLPLSRYGYRPQSVECGRAECRVTWQGQGANVSPADKYLLPNLVPAPITDPVAVSVFGISPDQESLPASRARSPEELQVQLVSVLARRLRGMRIDPSQPVNVPPPPQSGLAPGVAAHVGTWAVSISAPAALVKAREALGLMKSLPVRVQSVKFHPQQGNVELSGDYIFLPDAGNASDQSS